MKFMNTIIILFYYFNYSKGNTNFVENNGALLSTVATDEKNNYNANSLLWRRKRAYHLPIVVHGTSSKHSSSSSSSSDSSDSSSESNERSKKLKSAKVGKKDQTTPAVISDERKEEKAEQGDDSHEKMTESDSKGMQEVRTQEPPKYEKDHMKKIFEQVNFDEKASTMSVRTTKDSDVEMGMETKIQTLILPLVSRDVDHVANYHEHVDPEAIVVPKRNLNEEELEDEKTEINSTNDIVVEVNTIIPHDDRDNAFGYIMSFNIEISQIVLYFLVLVAAIFVLKKAYDYMKKNQPPAIPVTKNPVVAMEQGNVKVNC